MIMISKPAPNWKLWGLHLSANNRSGPNIDTMGLRDLPDPLQESKFQRKRLRRPCQVMIRVSAMRLEGQSSNDTKHLVAMGRCGSPSSVTTGSINRFYNIVNFFRELELEYPVIMMATLVLDLHLEHSFQRAS
jgi:hypothetical protein